MIRDEAVAVLNKYSKQFDVPYKLVGGLAYQGSSEHDIDILVDKSKFFEAAVVARRVATETKTVVEVFYAFKLATANRHVSISMRIQLTILPTGKSGINVRLNFQQDHDTHKLQNVTEKS